MWGQGHHVNRALSMHEMDAIPLFLTPNHNLIATTATTHAIIIPKGTPGYDKLH